MIKIKIKSVKDKSVKILEKPITGCWIDVSSPSEEEIYRLIYDFKIPKDFVLSSLDEDERPRVEKEGRILLVIVRIPHRRDKEVITLPLGIIITEKYFVTICMTENEVMRDFHVGKLEFYTTQKTRFLLQILKRIYHYYAKFIDEIEKRVRRIEASVPKSLRNEEITQLLKYQTTLVYFNGAIIGNEKVFERIAGGKLIRLYKQDEELLEDIMIDNKEIMENVRIFSEILSNTMDAYASIVSNNLNIIMKLLTSFTIILSIPTIVSSIYGMNIRLPLQERMEAFLILMIITLLMMLSIVFLFKKKEWL